jgi:hypothetical protein
VRPAAGLKAVCRPGTRAPSAARDALMRLRCDRRSPCVGANLAAPHGPKTRREPAPTNVTSQERVTAGFVTILILISTLPPPCAHLGARVRLVADVVGHVVRQLVQQGVEHLAVGRRLGAVGVGWGRDLECAARQFASAGGGGARAAIP